MCHNKCNILFKEGLCEEILLHLRHSGHGGIIQGKLLYSVIRDTRRIVCSEVRVKPRATCPANQAPTVALPHLAL